MANSRSRPGVVIVASILLMIFCGFKIFGACAGLAMPAITDALAKAVPPQKGVMNQADIQKALEKEIPGFAVVQIVQPALSLVLGLTGLFASIGCLMLKPTARIVAQVVSILIIVMNLAGTAYEMIYVVGPSTRIIQEQFDQQLKAQGNANVNVPNFGGIIGGAAGVFAVLGVVFNLALYLTIFFLLRSKASRDAFAGKAAPALADGAYEDDRGRSAYSGYEDDDDGPRPPPATGITDLPSR